MSLPKNFPPGSDDEIDVAAGHWLSCRDRGFTAEEQDAFSDWIASDPRHRVALRRLERTWSYLDSLADWQPADGAAPNPDLLVVSLANRRKRAPGLGIFAVCAFAAAAVVAVLVLRSPADLPLPPTSTPGMRVIPEPERLALADGSVAEINHGARLEVDFSGRERLVRLRAGEVHFSVAKDPARPFVVEVDGIVVRAVGTAFNVRLDHENLHVLVTEGTVQVEQAAALPVPVTRGERARLEPGRRTIVTTESPDAIAHELAWRGTRLEFEGLPLRAVVAEFNLRNARKLAIGDDVAGQVKVAGTFRADEPEAFVRLLEVAFGITVNRQDSTAWVLCSNSGRPEKK